MEKKFGCLLVIMLSVSLSQSEECSCPDTNTTTITYSQNEETLTKLRQQVEFLNSYNDKLLQRIEMLSARKYPRNCAEIDNGHANGIFTIQNPSIEENPFIVSCSDSYDGGWTVIQRRQDGSVDFYRNWTDYKNGFGDSEGEFFIGLDKLHALTKENPQDLLIVLGDFDGETKHANYDAFAIGYESEAYALNILGEYSGTAEDSFSYHFRQKFSTYDRDNDNSTSNCAETHKGGWWYADCLTCNLNGPYGGSVKWYGWHGPYSSLKYVQMMIRPRRN